MLRKPTLSSNVSNRNSVVLLFWASWLSLLLKLQQNGMFPNRTKAVVANSQQDLGLNKSTSAPAGWHKGRVVSFELICLALAVTWDVELCDYCCDRRTAPPKDCCQSPHLNSHDLWSERARLYKPGCTISASCLEVTWMSHKKNSDKSSQLYYWWTRRKFSGISGCIWKCWKASYSAPILCARICHQEAQAVSL